VWRVQDRERTLVVVALGVAAVALAGIALGHLFWPVGGALVLLSLGAAWWLRRRAASAAATETGTTIESGLRIAEKPLRSGRPRLPHALRLTISTEVAVPLGLRLVCDAPVSEVEALVQTGRGSSARQGEPPFVRESRQAWLFVVRNSLAQRELFLRVDLYAAQPIQVQRVEQIRPGGSVALPEWKELELSLATPPEDPSAEPVP
jgi:hypothetical protein